MALAWKTLSKTQMIHKFVSQCQHMFLWMMEIMFFILVGALLIPHPIRAKVVAVLIMFLNVKKLVSQLQCTIRYCAQYKNSDQGIKFICLSISHQISVSVEKFGSQYYCGEICCKCKSSFGQSWTSPPVIAQMSWDLQPQSGKLRVNIIWRGRTDSFHSYVWKSHQRLIKMYVYWY